MKHILNQIFFTDTINQLDEKYKNIVKDYEPKYFMYANMFDATPYYKPFSFRKNADYKLYEKLHTIKHQEVIECIKDFVLENNYSMEYLLSLYSYICKIIFNYYTDSYVLAKIGKIKNCKKQMFRYSKAIKSIEAEYYYQRFNTKIKKHYIDYKEINLSDENIKLLNEIFSTIYYSSIGIEVYKIGFNKFKKYTKLSKINFLGLSKPFYYTLDSLTRSKKYSISSLYIKSSKKRKDYLNTKKATWKLYGVIEEDKSFIELYEKAKNDCVEIINAINDEIFYQKKIKFGISSLLNKYIKNE